MQAENIDSSQNVVDIGDLEEIEKTPDTIEFPLEKNCSNPSNFDLLCRRNSSGLEVLGFLVGDYFKLSEFSKIKIHHYFVLTIPSEQKESYENYVNKKYKEKN
ncbi:hypothetical protein HYW76_05410 [Candidatus Pacearchaeota archaeon]|nr:hypothetical protein [Candidatus Pacearchaeota archaeon]